MISPYNVDRLLELGDVLLESNRGGEAKQTYDQIFAIDPNSRRGKVGKGKSMLVLGEVNEALELLKESANSRELASVFNTAAIINMKDGKHEKGMNLYKTAASVLGKNSKVLARLMYNMGIGYVKWKKPQKGLECFQKAVELDPKFENAKFNAEAIINPKSKKPMPAPVSPPPQMSEDSLPSVEQFGGFEESIGADLSLNMDDNLINTDFENDFGDDFDDAV